MENLVKTVFFVSPFLNGISFEFGGLNFNVERVLYIVFLGFIVRVVLLDNAVAKLNLGGYFFDSPWLVYAWPICLIYSCIISDDPLAHLSGLVISIAPFFVFFLFSRGGEANVVIERVIDKVLWFFCGLSIAVYFLWLASPSEFLDSFIDRDRVKLFSFEPNILGALIGYFWILHFPYFKKNPANIFLYIICLTSLLLTFSKAPYAAFLLGVFVYLALCGLLSFPVLVALAVLIIGIGVFSLLLADDLANFYYIFLDREDGVNNRLIGLDMAIDKALDSPFFGNGPLDFGLNPDLLLSLMGSEAKSDAWIWQMFVSIVHDTGFIGLVAYLSFVFGVVTYCKKIIDIEKSRYFSSYLAGFVVILVCSQSTTLHLSAVFGLALGLMASPMKKQ